MGCKKCNKGELISVPSGTECEEGNILSLTGQEGEGRGGVFLSI